MLFVCKGRNRISSYCEASVFLMGYPNSSQKNERSKDLWCDKIVLRFGFKPKRRNNKSACKYVSKIKVAAIDWWRDVMLFSFRPVADVMSGLRGRFIYISSNTSRIEPELKVFSFTC